MRKNLLFALSKSVSIAIIIAFTVMTTQAQNAANYTASSSNTASLALDINSNAIDMSTGTTQLVAASSDDAASAVTSLGFEFLFMGTPHTQFSVNSNGYLRFGSTVIVGTTRDFTAGFDLITPFGEDIMTHSSGKVHYKIVGTQPNRCLVVEWMNMEVDYGSTTANGTFQLRLYERTGVIEFVYGAMSVADAFSIITPVGARIGFAKGVGAGNMFAITTPSTYQQPASMSSSTVNNYPVGVIADLNSTTDGNRISYTLTPAVPSSPTNLTFSAVGTGSMTLNWTDATDELGYLVYRSTDGINYVLSGQVAADITTSVQTGLNASSTYYWRVYSFSEGTLGTTPASGTQATTGCGGIAGNTYSVGPTGTYPTITAAINAASSGVLGPVIFELQSNYSGGAETYPITFPTNPCLTSTNSILIRPVTGATGLEITSADPLATIDFNGAKYITIDGRPGSSGTTSQLTISNTNTSGVAVRFINDAQNNTVTYTDIQGQNTASPATGTVANAGVVYFSTANSGALQGNDNNTISFSKIHGTPGNYPAIGIFSIGSANSVGSYNDNCSIINSEIFDFFKPDAATTGIKIDGGNNAWTITGNHLYQTQPLTFTTGATHRALWITPNTASINNTAGGFTISNNFIGGSQPNAGGTPYSVSGSIASLFNGMDISVGLGTATSIQNNTVRNFAFNTTSTSTIAFVGINIANGNVDCGTTTGNKIGSETITGDIVFTTSGNLGGVTGIRATAGGIINIANNSVAGIDLNGSSATIVSSFNGINVTGGTTVNVTNNKIGNTDIINSINQVTPSTSTSAAGVNGINITGGTTTTVNGNIIANLNTNHLYTGTGAACTRGIIVTSSASSINNNVIRNLSSASATTGSGSNSAIVGIAMTSTNVAGCNVTGNIIDSLALTSSSSTAAMQITGLFYSGATAVTNNVAKNFIHSFDLTASNPNVIFTGIDNAVGTQTIANNMIRLGIRPDGSDLSNDNVVRGISSNSSSATNIYFNSIYIGGANVGATVKNSFAFIRTATSGAYDIKNNIFVNERSNASGGSGGKHYAVYFTTNTTGVTINSNVYRYNGNDGNFAFNGTADVTTYSAGWLPGDAGSVSGDPKFINPTGTASTVNLHIHATNPTPIESSGVVVASVTEDFDGQLRSALSPVDIGADAGNFVVQDIAPPVISYTPLNAACTTGDRTITATITDAVGLPTAGALVPRIYFKKSTSGTWSSTAGTLTSGTGTNGIWDFTISSTAMGGVANLDAIEYYIIAQDNTGNIGSVPGGVTASNVNTVTVHPTAPNSYIVASLSGNYNVGSASPAPFNTLTSAVNFYNNGCLTSAVTFTLTDAMYDGATETFPIIINANSFASAANTLTIKPAAGNVATITGSSATSVIRFDGADYVRIDGSNGTGTNSVCPAVTATRDLTIANTNTGTTSAVVWLQTNGTNAATNNTVMNTIITGNSNTTTLIGIGSGATTISTSSLGTGNNNNQIINNEISKTQYGIYSQGASITNKNTGTVINQNVINAVTPNNVQIAGIVTGFEDNITISGNNISGMSRGTDVAAISAGIPGIAFSTATFTGNEVTNAIITNNIIGSVVSTGSFSSMGIAYASAATGTTLIANNMISGVIAQATASDFIAGIFVGGGAGTVNVYYNSVLMQGTRAGSYPSYALAIGGTTPIVNVKNNILVNTQSGGTARSFAIGLAYTSTVGNYAGITSDNNVLYTSGTASGFAKVGSLAQGTGTEKTTLADWQTETGKDAASKNVLPVFVSATDLHLETTDPTNITELSTSGTVVSVTTDIDCETRGATPSIGADNLAVAACSGAVGGTATAGTTSICGSGSTTITATGYSIGAGSGYQWESSPDNTTWSNILNQTGSSVNTGTISTTTYYRLKVTCTSGTATAYSTVATVTVNPLPTVTITPGGATSFCPGESVTLTASGTSNTYAWSPSTGLSASTGSVVTASPTATTTYTVTGTITSTGCTNTATQTITVQPVVEISSINSNTTVCLGGSVQLNAEATVGLADIKITEITQFRTGTGATSPYPTYASGADLIEISNIGASGKNVGGLVIEVWTATAVYRTITIPQGTIIPAGEVMVIHIGAGTDDAANRYFNTGGTNDGISSTTATGYLLKTGGSVLDAVATNSYVWPGGAGVTASQWTGNIASISGLAGARRTVAIDNNAASDWTVSSASNVQNIGTYNGGFTPVAPTVNYSWSPSTFLNSSTIANPLASGITANITYTLTVTDPATSCNTSANVTVTVSSAITPTTPLAGTAGGVQVCSSHDVATSPNFFAGNCDIIATVTPSGALPVSGAVNACVKVESTVPTAAGTNEPYVARHYNIIPATNAATATSTITLYFLQSEFDAFNAARGLYAALPTGTADNTGKANLRVSIFPGTATTPGAVGGIQLDPADTDITFADGRWSVSFAVVGSGSFFVHTGNFTLPVTLVNFRGEQSGSINKLIWSTSTETNNKGFELERSSDGRNFSSITFVASKAENGNSNSTLNYNYNDVRPLAGNNYYRLKQVDKDGKTSLSNVVLLSSKVADITLSSVYPNPATRALNLVITSPRVEKVTIIVTDLTGKVLIQRATQLVIGDNQEFFSVQQLAAGTYFIKAVCANGCETAVQRFIKQ